MNWRRELLKYEEVLDRVLNTKNDPDGDSWITDDDLSVIEPLLRSKIDSIKEAQRVQISIQ